MRLTALLVALIGLSACDDTVQPDPLPGPDVPDNPHLPPVSVEDGPAVATEKARVEALVEAARSENTDSLLARHAVPFAEDLGYDPLDAQNLEIVQDSPFALDEDELNALKRNGFVISARQPLGNFLAGYELIYNADLPVYISADSLLHALHRGYSTQLKNTETRALRPALDGLLKQLHDRLAAGAADAWGAEAVRDLDAYLTVARRALTQQDVPLVAGGDEAFVNQWIALVNEPQGLVDAKFFGMNRRIDTSQFEPRGHYRGEPDLETYFRSMMWLGRVDLRMVEVDEFGDHQLNRRGVRAVLALNALFDADSTADWRRMETLLRSFVGPQDFLDPSRFDALEDALAPDLNALAALDDNALVKVLNDSSFDVQRIRGQFMQGRDGKPAPLPISATIFGQRYIVDSHVLSKVVWDTVQTGRMMPDPLDAAFAALGNNQAVSLLEDQLRAYDDYAPELATMRALIDDRPEAEWQGDLYSGWINALRALSPDPAVAADPAAHGRPSVWGTEAWGRRMLNTQLGSWTELRHDNLLYAKPSYTGGGGCDYPDGYVEPVPAFYKALIAVAANGIETSETALADVDPRIAESIARWWRNVHDVATTLHALAEQQITGEPFDADQILWLEQAVDISADDYIGYNVRGWYGELLMLGDEDDPYAADRLVADIHTQPTDRLGTPVGKVLHMGTGDVRLMVTTVESCTGPRAYVGPVYATHSVITDNFERLNDQSWNARLADEIPAELPWMVDLVVR